MALSLAQDSAYLGNDFWQWSVWLDGPDEQLDDVEHVVYTLHPSFPDPVRTVADRQSRFKLQTAGWGVFRLYANVIYKDGTEEPLEHDLVLSYPEGEVERPEEGAVRSPLPAKPVTEEAETSASASLQEADGVFEGGAVSPMALAAALVGAKEIGGVERWVNVVGSSGGALVASLLAVGYSPAELVEIFQGVHYRRFLDVGPWGRLGGVANLIRGRGMAPGRYLRDWLGELFEQKVHKRDLTFGDIVHPELSDALSPTEKYRLRLVASDITSGRMIVLPDDIEDYEDEHGQPLKRDEFLVADAVRMSMSVPFVFTPMTLYRRGREYHIVDGRVLSTFPIWLFDTPSPKRPTWGFHVHGGSQKIRIPYHPLARNFAVVQLAAAILTAVVEAWDARYLSKDTAVRTVSIETHHIRSNDFAVSREQLEQLYRFGYEAARDFFGPAREYFNSLGAGLDAVAPSTLTF